MVKQSKKKSPKKRAKIKKEPDVVSTPPLEAHAFIPSKVRHHFKIDNNSKESLDEQSTLIRHTRKARSAQLLINPAAKTLYTAEMEREITLQMTLKRSLTKLKTTFDLLESGNLSITVLQLQRQVIMDVQACLSDCDIYIGMLTPKLQEIEFVAASSKSNMKGKALSRGAGITFNCTDTGTPIIMQNVAGHGNNTDEQDIHFFDRQSSSIIGPLAIFPLRARRHTIGVLTVDGCRKATSLLPSSMSVSQVSELLRKLNLPTLIPPLKAANINGERLLALNNYRLNAKVGIKRQSERNKILQLISALKGGSSVHLHHVPKAFTEEPTVLEFLNNVANLTGLAISRHKLVQYKQMISNATLKTDCTMAELYDMAISAILKCFVMVKSCTVWRVEEQKSLFALGGCTAPEDKLVPFQSWSERNIKKVMLHKEDADSNGAMLTGNVIRISLPENNSSSWLEGSIYQVLWSNGSTEKFTWPRLKIQLTVRPLNFQHHQIRHILDKVLENHDFALSDPNCYVAVFKDPGRPLRFTYVISTVFREGFNPIEASDFISEMVYTLEPEIKCIRGRNSRDLSRRKSIKLVSDLVKNLNISASEKALVALNQLVTTISTEITENLPGVEVTFAELEHGGKSLRCTFGSTLDETTTRYCFECLNANEPKVDISGESKVYLPMFHEDARVGVLVVAIFSSVPIGREDESHPEHGVVDYLSFMATSAASVIRNKRRSFALYQLSITTKDPFANPKQVLHKSLTYLRETLPCSRKLQVAEVDLKSDENSLRYVYEFYVKQRDITDTKEFQYIEALKYRREEVTTETIQSHFNLGSYEAEKLLASLEDVKVDWKECGTHFRVPQTKYFEELNRHRLETSCKNKLRQLLRQEDFVFAVIPALSSATLLTVILIRLNDPTLLFYSDHKYLELFANGTSDVLSTVCSRLTRCTYRISRVKTFQHDCEAPILCVHTQSKTASDENDLESGKNLQQSLIKIIQQCIRNCNVYVGLLQPHSNILSFTSASSHSNMKGKQLRMGKGVCFSVIRNQKPLVIYNDSDGGELRHYGDPKEMKWPFIVIPLQGLGVVCVDNFSQQAKGRVDELHPEMGILDFLTRLGRHLGMTLQSIRSVSLQRRAFLRRQAEERVQEICFSEESSSKSELEVQEKVIAEITKAFLDADVYFGMTLPLSQTIEFTSSSSGSTMKGRHISGEKSASYECFASQSPVIITCIEDSKSRLKHFTDFQHGVYAALPVPTIGILVVDGFPGAASGRYSTECPEHGVTKCLKNIASTFGQAVLAQRSRDALEKLSKLVKGNETTFAQMVYTSFGILSSIILSAKSISLLTVNKNGATKIYSRLKDTNIEEFTMQEPAVSCIIDFSDAEIENQLEYQNYLVLPIVDSKYNNDESNTRAVIVIERWSTSSFWESDKDFLGSAIPLLNSAWHDVREKEYAKESRINGLAKLKEVCGHLDSLPARVAYMKLSDTMSGVCEVIAKCMGPKCDVYLGDMQPGGRVLKFISTSSQSLVKDICLSDSSSLTFECMASHQALLVNQLRTHYRDVKFLTSRKATGAFMICPLFTSGEAFGVLSADSFGPASFNIKGNLELDVFNFLKTCSEILQTEILNLRRRFSCDQVLRVKKDAKSTINDLFGTLLTCVKRDVLNVQSQQVVELAYDFTGSYELVCWYRQRARRPIKHVLHHCHERHCQYKSNGIHFESLLLPMTNLPRTLDESQATGKPTYLIEKRGKIPCVAAILDTKLSRNRTAIIIYGKEQSEFSELDVEHMTKMLSIARQVYSFVFKMQLTRRIAWQALFYLKNKCTAKESSVVSCLINPKFSSSRSPGVTASTSHEKMPLGTLRSKAWKRLMDFVQSSESISIVDMTLSTDKRKQENYPNELKAYEKQLKEFQQKKKGALAEPKKPLAPPPRSVTMYVRVSGKKDLRVAEVVVLNLHLSPTEDEGRYIEAASRIIEQCRDTKESYLVSGCFSRDIDIDTILLLPLFKELKESFITNASASSILDIVKSWLPVDTLVRPTAEEKSVVLTSFLFLGYKKSFVEKHRAAFEVFEKNEILKRLGSLNPVLKENWGGILRGKTMLSDVKALTSTEIIAKPLHALLDFEISVIALSRHSKYKADRSKTRQKSFHASATQIQRFVRGNFIRSLLRRQRRQKAAAIVIQCTYRRFKAIRDVDFIRRRRAATRIQRVFRKKYKKSLKPVIATGMMSELKNVNRMRSGSSFAVAMKQNQELSGGWFEQAKCETFEEFSKTSFAYDEFKVECSRISSQLKELSKLRSKMDPEDRIIDDLSDVFDFFDEDLSGNISHNQTTQMIKILQIPLKDDELIDAIYMIDADRSGDVSFKEFCNWYQYEYPSLRKRSKNCGLMSTRGRKWFVESQARRVVKKRWILINKKSSSKSPKKKVKRKSVQ